MSLSGLKPAFLLAMLTLLCLGACAGEARNPAPSSGAPADPAQPDPALMAQLSAELARVLEQEGTAKRSNEAPVGTGSAVADLVFHAVAVGLPQIAWSYRNQGDYDLNGAVTIADLTPVGLHYGKRFGDADWISAQYADGDNNGEVNIGDVTPIGQNFGGVVEGFEIQMRSDDTQPFALRSRHELSTALPAGGGVPRFSVEVAEAVPFGTEFRVLPYIETDGVYEYGPVSNEIGGFNNLAQWPTRGHGVGRTGLTQLEGPLTDDVLWSLQLEGSSGFSGTIIDGSQTIYIGTAVEEDDVQPGPERGFLYALTIDGEIRWRFAIDAGCNTQPVVGLRGDVIFADYAGRVYSMTPDGKLNWLSELPATFFSGWIMAFSDGYYMVGFDPGLLSARLHKVGLSGELEWNKVVPPSYSGPFLDFFDRIGVCGSNADLHMFLDDGTEDQVIPVDGSIASVVGFAAAVEDRIVVPTDAAPNSLLQILQLGFPPVTHDYGDNEPTGALGINALGQIMFAFRPANVIGGEPSSVLRLVDNSGAEVWSMPIGASVIGQITSDTNARMYFAGLNPENNAAGGVYCMDNDQTLRWIYETQRVCLQPAIVANGKLLLNLTDLLVGEQTTDIVMLGSN